MEVYPPFSKTQVFEIKRVIYFDCRLLQGRKMIAKMKAEPGMLLKTKDRNRTVREEPGMYMKNKPLMGDNRECS